MDEHRLLIRPLHLLSTAWVWAGRVLTTALSHWARTRIPGPRRLSRHGRPTDRTGRGWRKGTAPVPRQSIAHRTAQNGRGPARRDRDRDKDGWTADRGGAEVRWKKLCPKSCLSLLSKLGNQHKCINEWICTQTHVKHTHNTPQWHLQEEILWSSSNRKCWVGG